MKKKSSPSKQNRNFNVIQNYLMLRAANTNCFKFLFFFKYVSKEYYYFFQFAYNSLLLFGLTFPKMYIMMHSICKFESIILFLTTTAQGTYTPLIRNFLVFQTIHSLGFITNVNLELYYLAVQHCLIQYKKYFFSFLKVTNFSKIQLISISWNFKVRSTYNQKGLEKIYIVQTFFNLLAND